MKSPSWLSPSSPIVWSRLIGSRAYCWISSTFSGVMSISLASSSGVGSRPRSCKSSRWMRPSLLMTSTMCTGMRMVRAWSAMARVIAWRIHHVAYVPAQVAAHLQRELLARLLGLAQPLGALEPGFDPLGEVDLLLGVEQGD